MPAIEATETNDVKPVLPARLPSPASRKPICHSYGRFRNRFFTGKGTGGECGAAAYEPVPRASLTRSMTVATSPASSNAASSR